MNSLKKGEGVPLLNFVGGPRTPLLNFEGDPEVPLLNFEAGPEVLVPLLHYAKKTQVFRLLRRKQD